MHRQHICKATDPLLVAAAVQAEQLWTAQRIRLIGCWRWSLVCGLSIAVRINSEICALRCIKLTQCGSALLSGKQAPAIVQHVISIDEKE